MAIRSETVTYQADGLSMIGEYYSDTSKAGSKPGVLVFPEGFGLGEHAKEKAKRLAELGYGALACDLHGDGKVLSELPKVMELLGILFADPMRTRARSSEALKVLLKQPDIDASKIGAIGFCFGGTMALELARSGAAIKAAVGFHSGLGTARPGDAKDIKAKVLVLLGVDDPSIDIAQRTAFEEEMRAGKVDWRMHLYGRVVHSFTNPAADQLGQPDFARYDANADQRSWREMLDLFGETLR